MARKKLLECAFLIPIRRDPNMSDGRLHRRSAWAWLEESLAEFGGATRDTALHKGWYVDPDTQARVDDESRRYMVAVPQNNLARLRSLLAEVCVVFQQKCVYLSVAGHVEFVEEKDHETK
jgi:hypothetical protein